MTPSRKQTTTAASNQSRRKFFKWAGQITAGASLAAIGLASTAKSSIAHASTMIPNCIQCPAYGTCDTNGSGKQCYVDSQCKPPYGNGGGPYTSSYTIYTGGCVQPGHSCPTQGIIAQCFPQCYCQ